MKINIRHLGGLKCRPAATQAAILAAERQLGIEFPLDYAAFLRIANGGEGFIDIDGAYVSLWPVEDLVPLNESYEVQQSAPGLVIIGSDGAGEAYGIDTRTSNQQFVQMPFVVMDWREAKQLGGSFIEFLEQMRRSTV